MNLPLVTAILYFVLGLIQDVLIARYYLAVSRRRPWAASAWGFLVTGLGIWVIERIIVSNQVGILLMYCAGCSVGTFAGVKYGKNKPAL